MAEIILIKRCDFFFLRYCILRGEIRNIVKPILYKTHYLRLLSNANFYVSTNNVVILSRYHNRRFPRRPTRQVNYFAEQLEIYRIRIDLFIFG